MTIFLEHRPLLSSPCERASYRPWISVLDGMRVPRRLSCRGVRVFSSCGQPFVSESLAVQGRGRELFELMRAHDLEGIVAKRLDDPYGAARQVAQDQEPQLHAERGER